MIKHPSKRAILLVLGTIAILGLLYLFAIRQQIIRSRHYAQLLEEADWMNQHDSLFTTDSVMLRVAQHYDHWWHPRNRRMKAYYLLGCAYRDMGEASAAIHYYNIATEQADTTAKDCDFATLFRVYGQMAVIYGQQNLIADELEVLENYCKYALLADDTLSYIIGLERRVGPLYRMDDTTGVFRTTDLVCSMYERRGLKKYAAKSCATAIYVCLKNGLYEKAQRMMANYEREAEIYDDRGQILPGHELFYEFKGLLYLGLSKLDSAEISYRALLDSPYKQEAYRGLLTLYSRKGETDSVTKYAPLYESTLAEWATRRQASAVIQSAAIYKYERNANLAKEKKHQMLQAWYIILLLTMLLLFVVLLSMLVYNRAKQHQKAMEEEFHKKDLEYETSIKKYQQLRKEYEILKNSLDSSKVSAEVQDLLKQKEEKIESLEKELGWFRDRSAIDEILTKEEQMKEDPVVAEFRERTILCKDWKAPTSKMWKQLSQTYQTYMPLVFTNIADMPFQEKNTCILTHMGFAPGEMAILLETSPQRITNVRIKANYRLSGSKEAASLLETLRAQIRYNERKNRA